VLWFDDSKATNAHAASASLSSFKSVVWIVGGLLKGVEIAPLIQSHSERLKAAVVIGLDRQPVLSALASFAPGVKVVEISDEHGDLVMQVAVQQASALAEEGDVVLLAPAAASMDQFKDYADRGNQFAKAVGELNG
jgi:UDP-N-acetylmuramoylalanine--D-glutamate ligase